MLTAADIVTAVEAKLPQEAVTREALLRALLTEDEADLLIALRRERDEEAKTLSSADSPRLQPGES